MSTSTTKRAAKPPLRQLARVLVERVAPRLVEILAGP
jgi:hypothetical protein